MENEQTNEARHIALEMLRDEAARILAEDVGRIATPLDHLPRDVERAAVEWVILQLDDAFERLPRAA